MSSSSPLMDVSTQSLVLVSRILPFFLDTHSLSMSSLGLKATRIVINSLVLCSICMSFSLVHFRNDPDYITISNDQMYFVLLSILADLNNTVIWMVSTRSLISMSSSSFTNPLMTLPSVMFWPSTRPKTKCYSKVMHRKEVTHSNGQ